MFYYVLPSHSFLIQLCICYASASSGLSSSSAVISQDLGLHTNVTNSFHLVMEVYFPWIVCV